jgi:hypothetical protein
MYPIGTLKLTWINPKDYTILNSTMFKKDELQSALEASKLFGNDFMLFELIKTKGDGYSWKLLPYGDAKRFVSTMKIYDNILFKPLVILGVFFAFYGIYEMVKK